MPVPAMSHTGPQNAAGTPRRSARLREAARPSSQPAFVAGAILFGTIVL